MRTNFDEQLETLNIELITMGALCEDAISAAVKALLDDNRALVSKASEAEQAIDRKERDIESLCMKLLLRQQPVASDLRMISSALKMISDMERIGDQASDIAEITRFIMNSDAKGRVHIAEMAREAIKMVTGSVESFVNKDLSAAESVIAYDDVVDNLFCEIKSELIGMISDGGNNGEVCIDLLMIAKYLERIGDHAVNIAEWVKYSLTGKHKGE